MADSFGLGFGLGPDLAVDTESCMPPEKHLLNQLRADELRLEEESEDLPRKELGKEAVGKRRDMMEAALSCLASLGHQEVQMGVEIYLLSERLDDGHNTRAKLCCGDSPEVFKESLDGHSAELSQKPAFVLEEDAQHLGDGEDDLAVRNNPGLLRRSSANRCCPHVPVI